MRHLSIRKWAELLGIPHSTLARWLKWNGYRTRKTGFTMREVIGVLPWRLKQ